MLEPKQCKKCKLPDGTRGMVEDGAFIAEYQYYMGRGSLQAVLVNVKLDENGICNICTKGIKNFKSLKERNRSG